MKLESEIEKWDVFIKRACRQQTNKSETSTSALSGASRKDWNNPCAKTSAASRILSERQLSTAQPALIMFILSILMVIEHIFELKSPGFCDFKDDTNGFNNGIELEYDVECDTLSSPPSEAINDIPHTIATAFSSTPTGVGIRQTAVIGYDLIAALPVTTTAETIPIRNKNEMKYESGLVWEQTQTQSHRIRLASAPINDRIFIVDVIDDEFNDLECIFAVVLNETEFNYDVYNAFKYFFDENFDDDRICNTSYCELGGMCMFLIFLYFFLAIALFLGLFLCCL